MSKLVTISGERLALVLLLPEHGMPEIVAFGSFAEDAGGLAHRASRVSGMDISVPSAVLLPTGGMGFFGWPAIAGHREGQDFTAEFSHWAAARHDDRTVLSARDAVASLSIEITIAMVSACAVISVELKNDGKNTYTLDRCMAGSLVIGPGEADLTTFAGMWGREFHKNTQRLGTGLWLQESRRGRTSHDKSPGIILKTGTEQLVLHLGWSGNHVIAVDLIDDGRRLVHAGELFEPGEMRLESGESYRSPKLYVARDAAHLRGALRTLMIWPGGAMRPRPVTLNTWEGIYFDHRVDQLKAQADAAAELGIERFVLDDGWFGKRDDDTASLGDWTIDRRKYPDGLKSLVDHVVARGMEFGIWFEPEMVNPDSELFRAHPEWALKAEGRRLLTSRHQLVLDLTRTEVSGHLFDSIESVLSNHAVSYIKWDMNRDLTHVGGADGRAATARQTRAVYALMDRVRAAHPNVEIESCASGGGRADYGVLEHTQRIWTSDCTDALERLEIQRGARVFFPPEILGSHISASPNHQTHRRHTLAFRAIVAMAYHFGIELNPLTLTAEERAELKDWVALHKRLRPVLHDGSSFHLDPVDGRYVWGAVDDERMVIIVAQATQMMTEQPPPLVLHGSESNSRRWRIVGCHPSKPDFIRVSAEQEKLLAGGISFSNVTLTSFGLPIPMLRPESGIVLELERIEGV
jgi:alpha-galactosidase